jgi:hypothetical protein
MILERRLHLLFVVYPTALALAFSSAGCREDKPDFEVITLEGRIEKISLTSDETGEITVSYYSEKQRQEIVGTGRVTKDTEIMVNGAIAKLRDLREGERVRGEVRVDRKGGDRTQTALKIYVDRPKPSGGEGG